MVNTKKIVLLSPLFISCATYSMHESVVPYKRPMGELVRAFNTTITDIARIERTAPADASLEALSETSMRNTVAIAARLNEVLRDIRMSISLDGCPPCMTRPKNIARIQTLFDELQLTKPVLDNLDLNGNMPVTAAAFAYTKILTRYIEQLTQLALQLEREQRA